MVGTADYFGMPNSQSHPDLDSLEFYVLNRLNDSDKHELEEHLLLCHRCMRMAGDLDREIQMIRMAMSPQYAEKLCPLAA